MIGCMCIHGFTGGPYEVAPVANFLQTRTNWDVRVPTLPGHGRLLSLKNRTYQQWIASAEQTIQELKKDCDVVYIVGFSMGGMIAAYLAAKYKVDKLVLLSASRKYISLTQMARDIFSFIKDGCKGCLGENEHYQRIKEKRGLIPFQAFIEFWKCMQYTKPYIRSLDCPVLIAQGQRDGMVPVKSAYYLEKEIPSPTQLVLFQKSKHLLCLGEEKDEIFKSIYSFLNPKDKVSNP
ncbi:alpha/beta fold hydrolase [Radiobacillus kanasensis]|uniref:alpha/beta hydrolase n=1 Tax=Radiobacillus kanasensis TaxID=2844358 RepID=UPI001E65822C|nr:alpha/beta fold hydrolase [Radiobacillus kanasensis]UFT99812.1 alpha/beta fold hydrolase [Radiobacillus kanasensis]